KWFELIEKSIDENDNANSAYTYTALLYHATSICKDHIMVFSNDYLYQFIRLLIKKNVMERASPIGDVEVISDFCVCCMLLIKKWGIKKDYEILREGVLGIVDKRIFNLVLLYTDVKLGKIDRKMATKWREMFLYFLLNEI
ncbi:MAG: hypothetical protein DRN33_04380, partial [Thermoplasmata archaeon]